MPEDAFHYWFELLQFFLIRQFLKIIFPKVYVHNFVGHDQAVSSDCRACRLFKCILVCELIGDNSNQLVKRNHLNRIARARPPLSTVGALHRYEGWSKT